ncbi:MULTISPECIES: autoinducer 2 ABC transporter substrate-binding protein [unclassified Bacillus (in: firmicutes)]|uniref:autoinducer 2 ABC transporter substrate-binding protein n=1 Tax=unclassified Bacillus (in: firmicutes) TaxID=185979 RepID=UPI0020D2853F|nr:MULTISPECIES: autoinducer 2 ABC transporter substrate-binding protein [unclassified Bacillus (in: firmicutes)]
MNIKNYLKFLICFLIVIFVSGCELNTGKYQIIYNGDQKKEQNKQNESKENYTIAIVPKVSGIPYFNAVEEGAFEAGEDLNVNVLFTGPPIADWKQQRNIIEDFIQRDVDLIAVSANDPERLGPALQKAREKGIRVITWDSDTDTKYRELFINMVDPENLGRHLMDNLASKMGEKGEYAIMTGSHVAANLSTWMNYIIEQQEEEYPEMKLVDVVETEDNSQKSYTGAEKLLKTYPNLKGILGSSSVGPPAAAQAVKDAGKAGMVTVTGLSTPNLMRSYLKDGSAQMITLWSPKKLGYLTVSLAKELLNGENLKDGQHIGKVGNIKIKGDTVIMGLPIDFTRENIDQYDF